MSPLAAKCPGINQRPAGPERGGDSVFRLQSLVALDRTHRKVTAATGGGGRPPQLLESPGPAPVLRAHLLVSERDTCSPPTPSPPLSWVSVSEPTPGTGAPELGSAGTGYAGSRRALYSSLFLQRLARVGAQAGTVA